MNTVTFEPLNNNSYQKNCPSLLPSLPLSGGTACRMGLGSTPGTCIEWHDPDLSMQQTHGTNADACTCIGRLHGQAAWAGVGLVPCPLGGFEGMLHLQQAPAIAPAMCANCRRGARADFTAMCAGQGPRPCRKLPEPSRDEITHGRPGWHMLESRRRSNRMPCCTLAPSGSEKRAKRRCWARGSDWHHPAGHC